MPASSSWPDLHPAVEVMDGVDVDIVWDFFRFFEAGHHDLEIMNPLSSPGLDELVDSTMSAAASSKGHAVRILDIACGHGEFLLRCAQRGSVDAVGVDLSPWVLNRAAAKVQERQLAPQISFRLGSGTETEAAPVWDVVCGLGMSWVWGGFAGTAAALARRTRPGGVVVLGDIFLRDADNPTDDDPSLGPQLTAAQQRAALEELGLAGLTEHRTTPEDWDAYDAAVHAGVQAWVADHPEDTAYLDRSNEWQSTRHLLQKVGWTVWVGTKPEL